MANILTEFAKKYPTRELREEQLKKMANEQLDELIKAPSTIQSKVYISSFKKKTNT